MNMKNIIRNIFVGGMTTAMLLSCDMNLVPTTAIVYDENEPLLISENDVKSFQNGVLASYRSVQYGTYSYTSELMCDGFNAVLGYGNNYGIIHKTDDTFTPSNQEIEAVWANHYSAIKNYNIAIEGADNVAEELKKSASVLKGIALFCRASSYLHLARHWGPVYNPATANNDLCVPLILVYDQLEKPVRATVKEVYDQILLDLDNAEELLADVPGEIRSQIPTIDAVYALKARYYLDVQDYDNAAAYALNVIDSEAGYGLADTAEKMLAEYTNELGTEPVIQLYASKTEGLKGNTYYTLVSKNENTKYFSPYYLPTKALVSAYGDEDLRLASWFCLTDKNYTTAAVPPYPLRVEGSFYGGIYVFQKYRGNPNLYDGEVENGAHSAKPIMLGEMYLIAAEAYSHTDEAEAKVILNELQKARKADLTDGSLASVKKEWFRETVGEGLRLSCIKRWGDGLEARVEQDGAENLVMQGTGFTERTLAAGSHVFNWPIPTYEIQITPSLVQNDGYVFE